MVRPADRIAQLPASAIRAVMERVGELVRSGAPVCDLSIGRPDFDTPEVIKRGAIDALNAGKVHYGPNAGEVELRRKLAERIASTHGIACDTAQVVVTNGAVDALFLAAISTVNPGDDVLVPEPSWPYYVAICSLIGANAVIVPTRADDGFQIVKADLERRVTDRTRAIFFNSPNNPTGTAQGAGALEAVAAVARRHDLLVISDEVYDRIVIDGTPAASIARLPGMAERTAIVNAFSKTYSMTGWRLGYLAMPAHLARAAILCHTYTNTSMNTFTQYGAVAALDAAEGDVAAMVAAYGERHDILHAALSAIPEITCPRSGGGMFLYPRVAGDPDDAALAMRLLEEAHVATVPGSAFGPSGRGHLRVSFAADTDACREGGARIARWFDSERG